MAKTIAEVVFPPGKTGQPTKYTAEMVQEICRYIRNGATYRDSLILAGIGETTFHAWRKRYPDFGKAIELAETQFKNSRVLHIVKAGNDGDWRADIELLRSRYRDEYGVKSEIDVDVRHHIEQGVERATLVLEAVLAEVRGDGEKDRPGPRRLPAGKKKGRAVRLPA